MAMLKETVFSARFDEPMNPRKNLLWCATFQLAWDAFGRGADIKLDGSPELERSLNRHLVSASDIDEASYIAMAGFGRDKILDRVRAALKEKFGATGSLLPSNVRDIDILAYAYLYKNLEFATPFKELEPRAWGNEIVKVFGITNEGDARVNRERRKQVKVLHYASDADFVIELLTQSGDDRLILARRPPARTLQETVTAVLQTLGPASDTNDDEPLIVPQADFDLTHRFSELEGRRLLNKGLEEYVIGAAVQNIRFRLNEKGAQLKSEAALVAAGCGPRKVRVFDLCAPHLLMILRRGAQNPMFAMWRADAELAVK
jgi:hypothetical protein